MHKNEENLKKALSLGKGTQERKKELERLRLMGNFVHNTKVLAANEGELKVARRPVGDESCNPQDYIPCVYCHGFFQKDDMWRHIKTCMFVEDFLGAKAIPKRKIRYHCSLLLEPQLSTECSQLLNDKVLATMKQDERGLIAKSDDIILHYGSSMIAKHGRKKANYVSEQMRTMARLLISARKISQQPQLQIIDLIRPDRFNLVVEATKDVCGLTLSDDCTMEYSSRSTALKIGYAIKKAALIACGKALKERDFTAKKDVDSFLQPYELEWNDSISSSALNTLSFRKHNKPSVLPVTEDLVKLRGFLMKEIQELQERLERCPDKDAWGKLAVVTLTRLILFNKRRGGEAARMKLKVFENRPDWDKIHNEEIMSSLSSQERQLCKR